MPRISPDTIRKARETMPRVLAASNEFGSALWEEGSLDTGLKELLRIYSAQLAGCEH